MKMTDIQDSDKRYTNYFVQKAVVRAKLKDEKYPFMGVVVGVDERSLTFAPWVYVDTEDKRFSTSNRQRIINLSRILVSAVDSSRFDLLKKDPSFDNNPLRQSRTISIDNLAYVEYDGFSAVLADFNEEEVVR